MTTVKYPAIKVQLTGEDGSAFMIIGRTMKAMRRAGVDAVDIDAYRVEASSGNYDHVLAVTTKTVDVR